MAVAMVGAAVGRGAAPTVAAVLVAVLLLGGAWVRARDRWALRSGWESGWAT
ncbi:hypothetical protein JNW88_31800, partial [Micromonospora sp. ATA32]|nr:hypothetical protein [Micromonospora sp. ATA32]